MSTECKGCGGRLKGKGDTGDHPAREGSELLAPNQLRYWEGTWWIRTSGSYRRRGRGGYTSDHLTEESVTEAIFTNIHRKRFFLAEAAPICSGALRGQFGYNATSRTAKAILDGTYDFPPDFDQATEEILLECARIRLMIPINSLNTLITKEEWKR